MKKPRSKKCSICSVKTVGSCKREFDHYLIKNQVSTVDEAIEKAIHPTMMMFDITATRIKLGIAKNTSDAISRIRQRMDSVQLNKGK